MQALKAILLGLFNFSMPVMQLLLVLLVVYAIAIMAALSFLMMFLVRRAAKSRLRLFSIFTALPRPTVMALASQSISVTGTVLAQTYYASSNLRFSGPVILVLQLIMSTFIFFAGGSNEDEEEEAWQQANVSHCL